MAEHPPRPAPGPPPAAAPVGAYRPGAPGPPGGDRASLGSLPAYRWLVLAQVRAQLQYRLSFALDVAGSLMLTNIEIVTVLVIFRVTPRLGGFDVRSAFLMATLAGCSFAWADLLVGNIDRMRQRVRTGQLDTLLIRPLSVLGQIVTTDFGLRRIGRAATGTLGLIVAVHLAHPRYTPGRVALLAVAPVSGTLFFISIFIAGATVAFWWIESGEAANSFTYGGRDFTTYPITVYTGAFRHVFAYGLGFGFVAYYPALALLGRPDPLGLPGWVGWCSPAVALVAFTAGMTVWRIGIRHYRSTGS